MEGVPQQNSPIQQPPVTHHSLEPGLDPRAYDPEAMVPGDVERTTDFRRAGMHMLRLLCDSDATLSERAGARMVLKQGTFAERGALFLFDLVEEDANDFNDSQTPWREFDSARALVDTSQAPPSLERAVQSAGEHRRNDYEQLKEAVFDIWDSVIDELPPHEYAALLEISRDHRMALPIRSIDNPETLQKMSRKLAELQSPRDALLGVEAVIEIARHQQTRVRLDGMKEGCAPDGQQLLRQEDSNKNIVDGALATLPLAVAQFVKGAQGDIRVAALETLVDAVVAGCDMDAYMTLSAFDTRLGDLYHRNEQASRDSDYTERVRAQYVAAAELLRREDKTSREIVDIIRHGRKMGALLDLVAAKSILDEPAFRDFNRTPENVLLLAEATSYEADGQHLQGLRQLDSEVGLEVICKMYEKDVARLRVTIEDLTYFNAEYPKSNARAAELRQLLAHISKHANVVTLFQNKETGNFIKQWFEEMIAHGRDVLANQFQGVDRFMDFLSDAEVVAAIDAIQTNNPELLRGQFRFAEADSQEVVKRRLETLARIPKDTVDVAVTSMLTNGPNETIWANGSFDILGDIEDPTFVQKSLMQICADHLLDVGMLSSLRVGRDEQVRFSAAQLKAVEDLYLGVGDKSAFQAYMQQVIDLPPEQRPPVMSAAIRIGGMRVSQRFAQYVQQVFEGTLSKDEQRHLGLTLSVEMDAAKLPEAIGAL